MRSTPGIPSVPVSPPGSTTTAPPGWPCPEMSPTTPSGHLLKVPVVVKPEYVIALEQWKSVPFIHCDIYVTWTPKVKRQLQADFGRLFEIHGGPFVALHDPSDRK